MILYPDLSIGVRVRVRVRVRIQYIHGTPYSDPDPNPKNPAFRSTLEQQVTNLDSGLLRVTQGCLLWESLSGDLIRLPMLTGALSPSHITLSSLSCQVGSDKIASSM